MTNEKRTDKERAERLGDMLFESGAVHAYGSRMKADQIILAAFAEREAEIRKEYEYRAADTGSKPKCQAQVAVGGGYFRPCNRTARFGKATCFSHQKWPLPAAPEGV